MDRRLRGALLHLNFTRAALGHAELEGSGANGVDQPHAGPQAGPVVFAFDAVETGDAATALLDAMDEIFELTTLGATRYGGNWTTYRELKAQELAAAQRTLADAEKRITDAARTALSRPLCRRRWF